MVHAYDGYRYLALALSYILMPMLYAVEVQMLLFQLGHGNTKQNPPKTFTPQDCPGRIDCANCAITFMKMDETARTFTLVHSTLVHRITCRKNTEITILSTNSR